MTVELVWFRQITQGVDSGAYYHKLFLRSRPQFCMRIRWQKAMGTGHKQPTDVQSEPNFYARPHQSAGYLPHLSANKNSTRPMYNLHRP
eukprot:11790676-Ditylum_brightwellii.AAC.1